MPAEFTGPARPAAMRVSDAEREDAAAELREHYAAGRLTAEELDERLDQAFAARTDADLTALMHDLPSLRPGPQAVPPPPGDDGWQDEPGPGWAPGRAAAWAIATLISLSAIAVLCVAAAFSFGGSGSRPFAIIAILAAFAFLRRLIFRRRAAFRRGPARGRRGPARRRPAPHRR